MKPRKLHFLLGVPGNSAAGRPRTMCRNHWPKRQTLPGSPRLCPVPVLVSLLDRDLEQEVGDSQGRFYGWATMKIEHEEVKRTGPRETRV